MVTSSCVINHHRLHNHAGEDACVLCFAERLKAMARLRCGGDCRTKSPPPAQPTQARLEITTAYTTTQARTPAFSALQSAFGRWPGCAAGATTAKITTAHTTDAGETRNHYRLHNRRRRGRLRSLLCRAPSAMARLRCAHFGDGQAAQCSPFLRGRRRCETQHHPLRGLCTFDTTYLGLVLTDFTRG